MKRKLQRSVVAACLLLLCARLGASAGSLPESASPWLQPAAVTRSASGQFVITYQQETSPLYRRPELSTNAAILQLQAPWLAVSAERFRSVLWRELGIAPNSPWSGKIFVTVYSARSLSDSVVIAPQPFLRTWNCALDLPDLINSNRYARALSAVLLLELANRNTPVNSRSAELPAWLVDGLAREVIESDESPSILSKPTKIVNEMPQADVDKTKRGLDTLASARRILQSSGALTFDQLSWPTDAQMNGDDGGVYLATSQLFINELLKLKQGQDKLQEMIRQLSHCQNWQTAFFRAFRDHFSTPLEAEKWWALRVVAFAARDPGPRWTVVASRQKLDTLLAVPIGVRYASNALPVRTEVSLQSAIQSFDDEQRVRVLETKLRDLELVRLRLAAPFILVADGYYNAIADFLGAKKGANGPRPTRSKFILFRGEIGNVKALLKKLDTLDARRRQIEAGLDKKGVPAATAEGRSA
jgi:hypothetical protein